MIAKDKKEELVELLKKPNVKVVKGEDGKTWTCWDAIDEGQSLNDQNCQKTDEVTYDRGF